MFVIDDLKDVKNMSEKTRILDRSTFSSKFRIIILKKVKEAFNINSGQGGIFMLKEAEEKVGVLIGI